MEYANTLKKVSGNPSNGDLGDAVNRLVDEVKRISPKNGINIRLERTPFGTIINAEVEALQASPEESSGDLRFS